MDAQANTFVSAIEKIGPSVVRVSARRSYDLSGVVWAEDVVVTTSRAVEREEDIHVTLADGRTVAATLQGRDPGTDLAVLRATTEGLSVPEWADADALKVGQFALIVGRPGESVQATSGIVSALGGEWRTRAGGRIDHFLQTDANTFPGFSGGPLVNLEGSILGINSSALMRGGSVTLPASTVRRVVGALLEHGGMRRGYLGLGGQPVRLPENLSDTLGKRAGLLITSVAPESPAADAGLVLGDTLVLFDGESVHQPAHLLALLDETRIGRAVPVTLVRGGEVQELTVTVGER